MKIWKDEEVKWLFDEVEKCKKQNCSLKEAFSAHAQKYGRKSNSVRNYYYADVDNLKKDVERAKRLGIDLQNHEKSRFVAFDKAQEEELFEKIKMLIDGGLSVRAACQRLSEGNLTLMTRLQNKFQNMQRKLKPVDNVIQFKQKTLTDTEINSLFLGLVKLIKKSAQEEIIAENHNKTTAEIGKIRKENTLLQTQISSLEIENEGLKKQINSLKKENASLKINLKFLKKTAQTRVFAQETLS